MAKFRVQVEWSGRNSGITTYEVEADTGAEAKVSFQKGKVIKKKIIDTNIETEKVIDVTKVKN